MQGDLGDQQASTTNLQEIGSQTRCKGIFIIWKYDIGLISVTHKGPLVLFLEKKIKIPLLQSTIKLQHHSPPL